MFTIWALFMDRLETMKAFVTVAELGSFTKAAEKLATQINW